VEIQEQSNGAAVHCNGAAGPTSQELPQEFKNSVSVIEAELNCNLQVLGTHISNAERAQRETLGRLDALFESWGQKLQGQYAGVQQHSDGLRQKCEQVLQQIEVMQRRYDGVQQQFKGVQHQHDGIRQEFQALQLGLQGLAQQFEATQQQCQVVLGFEPQFKGHAETIQGFERQLAGNATQFAALAASIEEEGRRRSNVEVSIGEFGQDIAKLKTAEIVRLDEEITSLRKAVASGHSRQRLAIAAAALALLAAGYVGLGKPGWPTVANYAAASLSR
jgi:chromosome segregation ATPase